MPTLKNPFVHGNLFLMLNIEFPQSLPSDVQDELRTLLPPPLNANSADAQENAEVHKLVDIDPVQSHDANKLNMIVNAEAYEEDEHDDTQRGSHPQCTQM